jgi:hypothetical protein
MAALAKKDHGLECPWLINNAYIYSGNRRTPRLEVLTTASSGANTSDSIDIAIDHEVRLLSLDSFERAKFIIRSGKWSRFFPMSFKSYQVIAQCSCNGAQVLEQYLA